MVSLGDFEPVVAEIELDRPRTIRIDARSWAAIEEVVGASLLTPAGERAFHSIGVRQLRAILHELLRTDNPELSAEDVGRLLGPAALLGGSPLVRSIEEAAARAATARQDSGGIPPC